MPKEVFMPKLSSTMEVGTLLQWFKEEGEAVEIGDPLFEILTDKINIEVESYDAGVLLKKYFQNDDEVPVNQIIGYIGEAGTKVPDQSPGVSGADGMDEKIGSDSKEEAPPATVMESRPVASGEKPRATPAARKLARESKAELLSISGSGPNGRIHARDVVVHLKEKVKITPLARKAAEAEQVDLTEVKGSGVNGKIKKADVFTKSGRQTQVKTESKRKKLSGMRRAIADRMAKSAFSAPHVTLTTEVDCTRLKELRISLLPIIEQTLGLRLSYTDILIKASAAALKRHPNINVSIEEDHLVEHDVISVGLAVSVEGGLVVPVIQNAAGKNFSEIAADARDLVERARSSTLKPDEMQGSTFTISNLGMYAIDAFTPIINQPDSAILGVGRIIEKPVVVDGNIEVRPMIALSLSFDHRVIDGAPAAAYLTDLKNILENPYQLLV